MKHHAVFIEGDAKSKWCPFARMSEAGSTYNRCGPAADLECIGSHCMAWRWHTTHIKDPAGSGNLVESADTYGYCGLAGAP